MKIEKKDGYTLFSTDENILQEALDTFFSTAEKHSTENIFFDISDNLNITPKEFMLFLNIASAKKENGTSFVVIIRSLDIDALPEELRNSTILTGNDLGLLGNVEALPTQNEIDDFCKNQEHKSLKTKKELHQKAQDYLREGQVQKAWCILLK